MSYKVKISPNAQEDIENIMYYLKVNLSNLTAAQNFHKDMLKQIDNICLFPNSGTIFLTRRNNRIIRKVLVRNYIMFYEFFDESTINILRVRYGASDWENLINAE